MSGPCSRVRGTLRVENKRSVSCDGVTETPQNKGGKEDLCQTDTTICDPEYMYTHPDTQSFVRRKDLTHRR